MSKETVLYIAFNYKRMMDVMKEMEVKLRENKVPFYISYFGPRVKFGDVTYRFFHRESCDHAIRGIMVDKIFFDDLCYDNLTPPTI